MHADLFAGISPELYLAFIAATVALVALPGPNVALITANSIAYGRRYGFITVAGTTAAMLPQLALTVFGMTSFLALAGDVFEILRWVGVVYLAYLGIQAWRAKPVDLTATRPEPRSANQIFLRGFLVSLSNPKTLFFYGAFFPQFIVPDAPIMPQLIILSLTFMTIAITLDCCWALLADHLRGLLATRGTTRNKLTAAFYLAAATGLASIHKS